MIDLRFNPQERDIFIEDGDFLLGTDESTGYQNGFILAGCPMASPIYPSTGLSLVDAIGTPDLESTLIRWQNTVYADGATSADYQIINNQDVTLQAEY
jgi:hypothetical protein